MNSSLMKHVICLCFMCCCFYCYKRKHFFRCQLFDIAIKEQRKMEKKNREFKVEWTKSFTFIQNWNNFLTVIVVLYYVYQEKLTHYKKSNLEMHFTTKNVSLYCAIVGLLVEHTVYIFYSLSIYIWPIRWRTFNINFILSINIAVGRSSHTVTNFVCQLPPQRHLFFIDAQAAPPAIGVRNSLTRRAVNMPPVMRRIKQVGISEESRKIKFGI